MVLGGREGEEGRRMGDKKRVGGGKGGKRSLERAKKKKRGSRLGLWFEQEKQEGVRCRPGRSPFPLKTDAGVRSLPPPILCISFITLCVVHPLLRSKQCTFAPHLQSWRRHLKIKEGVEGEEREETGTRNGKEHPPTFIEM